MHPSTELRDLTIQLAQAISDGDVAVLERHTSRHPGTAFLGTDPDEWWTDLAGLRHALAGQHEAGVTFIPGEPVAYQAGRRGLGGRSPDALPRRGAGGAVPDDGRLSPRGRRLEDGPLPQLDRRPERRRGRR